MCYNKICCVPTVTSHSVCTPLMYMQAYLKEMWAHSPQEAGHHPSKYLSPMVHTSSSKGCLVSMSRPNTRGQSDNLHDSERENNGDSPEMGSLDVPHDAMAHFKLFQQTTGRGSIKGEPNKQRGKRTRFNSFYVAMAATSFKTRPDKHRAKIKCVLCSAYLECCKMIFRILTGGGG